MPRKVKCGSNGPELKGATKKHARPAIGVKETEKCGGGGSRKGGKTQINWCQRTRLSNTTGGKGGSAKVAERTRKIRKDKDGGGCKNCAICGS